jgi:hypothetical protein
MSCIIQLLSEMHSVPNLLPIQKSPCHEVISSADELSNHNDVPKEGETLTRHRHPIGHSPHPVYVVCCPIYQTHS